MLFETEKLIIDEAVESDIETVIAIESHKDNRDYLWIGSHEDHLSEINDPNQILALIKNKTDLNPVGYCLIRLDRKSDVFELRRVAITHKGQGYGKEVMHGLLDYAFKTLNSNRFWLDVYPDNVAGIRLYKGLGMKRDGVLRQSDKTDRGYLDQVIYSILKSEYDELYS
ncbi:GNAT family N-acetyltransferase [Erysipelotrichaceae bacterium OttesenSCG-928-M19]|nr:GNAT family N-acetyltransferase [Erysipelotrichaceae bacterium OttesenSCG-928-M19]